MLTRTGGGFLWESHSTDKGVTWDEPRASTIANPGSRFFIRRVISGHLLLVNHCKFKGRSHLTARLSADDGATWNDGLLLDERGGVSYLDGVQDRDGLIWVIYDRDRNGAGEILLAKFREEDVTAGKNVSGSVALRQVINENGLAGETCWATMDMTKPNRYPGGSSAGLNSGERPGTHWLPAECDVSIRPGWFYHAAEDAAVKSPAQLLDIYYKSVGREVTIKSKRGDWRNAAVPREP